MARRDGTIPDEKARATRRKILVEATKLFARRGYHRTTVADIAMAIGMTQGAFFHHFPTKEALLNAVVERLSRGFADYREAMEGPVTDDTLRHVMDKMVSHYASQPEATICLAALATEFAGSGHPILTEIRAAYDSFVDPFARVFEGHPSVKNPRDSAIAFIGAVQGVAIQGLLREGEGSLDDYATAFLQMLHVPK